MVITTSYTKDNEIKTITYNRYNVNDANLCSLLKPYSNGHNHKRNCKIYRTSNGNYQRNIIEMYCAFDIETTKIDDTKTFMYGWQFGIDNNVIWGTTWEEFIKLLDYIKTVLKPKETQRIICFIANLGYEWQFMKNWLNVTDYFFKEKREPIFIEHDNFVQFRECLAWGGSLSKIATDYTNLIKLKGDLDYSIYRESYNDFTTKREWAYIDFDVLILTQFSKWYFKQYLTKGYIPVTVNSGLRHNMLEKANGKSLAKYLPNTYKEYETLVNLVYRGGYVHANEKYVGKMLKGLWSYDFTSSYPSSMLCEKYVYKFSHVENWHNYKKEIAKLDFDKYGFYGLFVFKNIRSTTSHSIESTSKCKTNGRVIEDNGRVKIAQQMQTWITEQDFLTYKEFYTWDEYKIIDLYVGVKDYLPKYLISEMCTNYTNKALLKAQHKPYAIEKTYVNMLYGTTVTKECTSIIDIVDNVVISTDRDMCEFWERKKKDKKNKCILLPTFGVYISAYSRRRLLSVVYQLETSGNPCIYMDTDSIKFFDYNKGKKIIENYNNWQYNRIKERCKYYGLDMSIYGDLGSFDCEYPNGIETFKTLGAKRYLHTYKDKKGNRHFSCTVAGLPKHCYIKRHATSLTNFYKYFKNGMVENNVKLCSNYNDTPFIITRNGKQENIKSCLTLNDVDFSLTMNPQWLSRLMLDSSKERRIL